MAAYNIQDLLLKAYKCADQNFKHASFLPGSVVNGMHVGKLSFFRHFSHETDLQEIITTTSDENTLIEKIALYLKETGCLWDPDSSKGNNHSFNNFFLIALRELDKDYDNLGTEIYRKIIEQAYDVVFSRGEQTLYRCEKEDRWQDIQTNGFTDNIDFLTRVIITQASQSISGTLGVSTSKHAMKTQDYLWPWDISKHLYGNYRYKIQLPSNHNLLLLDINAGLEKKGEHRQKSGTEEVNCLDTIPPQYIKHQKKISVDLSNHRHDPNIMKTTGKNENPISGQQVDTHRSVTRRGCF